VLRLGREIAEGLAAAHERGLIHRDIKPGNIWLDSAHKGRVKILDFGLARSGTADVHLTHSGAIVGTPAYMSPEQARGGKVDGRCDLFSLGCVLYRLCTGTMPFTGDTTMSLLMSLGLDSPKPVGELNPDMPVALSDLVARLLEKEPAKRPQSAREVVQAIQAISRAPVERAAGFTPAVGTNPAGINPAARTETSAVPPLPAPASDGKKRRPWMLATVAAGFVATAIAVAIVIIVRDKNGNEVAKVPVPPGGTAQIVGGNDDKPAKLIEPSGGTPTVIKAVKKDNAASAPKPPLDEAWVKLVASLPMTAQVEAVTAKLKERNPGFDGKVDPFYKDSAVEWLTITTDDVADPRE
jgi:eukaryotic-like serine/threonine-protein kinase